ncbi:MAG TPA: hypothetical protein VKG38_07930, partial [Solirubrobacteraceae bacterium]|nr:hypothetical protein [Solirubrobacteraceae bacterium]
MSSTRARTAQRSPAAAPTSGAGAGQGAERRAADTEAEEGAPGERASLPAGAPGAIEPLVLMQRVADQALGMIAAADGVLVGLVADESHLRCVCGAGHLAGFVGHRMVLEGSLAGRAIEANETLKTDDSETDERVNRDEA